MKNSTPLECGHYYHIYNRGNNKGNIFFEERNYRYFLELYGKYISPIADTYAYCLLKNHFHFLVRLKMEEDLTGFENLTGLEIIDYSKYFSNLFNAYTKAINKTYQRTGSLFEKHFKRILVDSDSYFVQLVSYIHRNPETHGFIEDFRQYPYSSYQAIRFQKKSRIETEKVLQWFGTMDNFRRYHIDIDENKITHLVKDDFL